MCCSQNISNVGILGDCSKSLPIYQVLEFLDNNYTHLALLDANNYWKLRDEDIYPKVIFELPQSVLQSVKTIGEIPKDCLGIIFLPGIVRHNGWTHERVRLIGEKTLLEVEPGAWFLLQKYTADHDKAPWYLLHKNAHLLRNNMSHQMIKDLVSDVTGNPQSKYATVMLDQVAIVRSRYNTIFGKMTGDFTEHTASLVFRIIVDEMFKDGIINWGRIVAVFALTQSLWEEILSDECKIKFLNCVPEVINTTCGTWIDKQGGFDAFLDYFPKHTSTHISVVYLLKKVSEYCIQNLYK